MLQALGVALGPAAVDGAPHAAPVDTTAVARFSWGWSKVVLGGFSVLTVGAGAIVAAHVLSQSPAHVASAPVTPPAMRSETAAPAAPRPVDTEPTSEPASESAAHGDPAANASRPRARAAGRPASDSLAEEVRLLSRAERQLSDGAGDGALDTLAEHERRFPKGALTEQRMAARVEALCALGRYTDARADLTKLARAYPQSPHLDGARRFCGSDFTSP